MAVSHGRNYSISELEGQIIESTLNFLPETTSFLYVSTQSVETVPLLFFSIKIRQNTKKFHFFQIRKICQDAIYRSSGA